MGRSHEKYVVSGQYTLVPQNSVVLKETTRRAIDLAVMWRALYLAFAMVHTQIQGSQKL
jgi:hypothetical protein